MELTEAKEIIEKEKQSRINSFVLELNELTKKYNCTLSVVYEQKTKEKPSEAEIIVIAH
jgi:hypothetical protein